MLANLFYDKAFRLPPVRDGAAWRILLAVQDSRMNAKLVEKLLDVQSHQTTQDGGRNLAQTFQEWTEALNPSARQSREDKEKRIRWALDQLHREGPIKVRPVKVSKARAIGYAQDLVKRES